jgi:hypothetical protein
MATSNAHINTNRCNAQKSTGPRTTSGKEASRRNSLKSGLTGAGIVLPDEDQAAIDAKFAAYEATLAPADELQADLVWAAAMNAVRMQRCAREEAARVGEKMRTAASELEDQRLAEAEHLLEWIAAEPVTNARRLRRTVEGVDLMIRAWSELVEMIDGPDFRLWDITQWQRIENLKGRRTESYPWSRDAVLCKVIWNDLRRVETAEFEGLDDRERKARARKELSERIHAELEAIKAYRATFDHEARARSRAEASTRAMSDNSKEGILARKYAASAERGFYKALKELREIQSAAAEAEAQAIEPEEAAIEAALGSFFPGSSEEVPEPRRRGEKRQKRDSKRAARGRQGPS